MMVPAEMVTVPAVRFPMVPVLAKRLVEEATPEAYTFVVVTFVNVAFVPVRFWREVFPRTVRVEVTVELAERKPPKNWRVVVAEDPRAVTEARVSDSTER